MKMYFESILIGSGFVLIIFALLLHGPHENVRSTPSHNQTTMSSIKADARVEFYKRQIGDRLNAQRLDVQYENMHVKKKVANKHHARQEISMHGLPLEGERHPFEGMQKPEQINKSAEAQIVAYVAFMQNLRDWEENARKQYIAEFMARAESMGYNVQVDKNYNVYYEYVGGERAPQSVSLNVPLSILAPRCTR